MKIRLAADLRDQIEREAEKNKRSLNAEVVARLEGSFSESKDSFSNRLRAQIEHYCEAHDLDFETAVSNILTAGLNPDAPLVISLTIESGTEAAKIHEILDLMMDRVPKKTRINVDPTRASRKKSSA